MGRASAVLVFGALTDGEEIGCRGYTLPRLLERHSALAASVVVGVVWALWHVPKFLTVGSAQDYPFWIFVLGWVATSTTATQDAKAAPTPRWARAITRARLSPVADDTVHRDSRAGPVGMAGLAGPEQRIDGRAPRTGPGHRAVDAARWTRLVETRTSVIGWSPALRRAVDVSAQSDPDDDR